MSTQFYFNKGNCWAFALSWQPLLQPLTRLQRRRFLKKSNAKAWLEKTKNWRSLGFSHAPLMTTPCFSAAAAFALLHPTGMHYALYTVEPGCYWLVGVHEGLPLKAGDQLFTSLEEAQKQYIQLAQRNQVLAPLELISIDLFYEQATAILTADVCLQAFKPNHSAFVACFFALTLSLVGAYSWADATQHSEKKLNHVASIEPPEDQEAIYFKHGFDALSQLFEGLQAVPVQKKGWQLQQMQCHPVSLQWTCFAKYHAAQDSAQQADFQRGLAESWKVSLQDLSHLRLDYVIPVGEMNKNVASPVQTMDLLNKLQKDKRWFQQLTLSEPHVFTNATQGSIRTRRVVLGGSWSALSVMQQWPDLIDWQKLTLTVPKNLLDQVHPDSLQWLLTGELHENH